VCNALFHIKPNNKNNKQTHSILLYYVVCCMYICVLCVCVVCKKCTKRVSEYAFQLCINQFSFSYRKMCHILHQSSSSSYHNILRIFYYIFIVVCVGVCMCAIVTSKYENCTAIDALSSRFVLIYSAIITRAGSHLS